MRGYASNRSLRVIATVTITEALRITQSVPRDARPFNVTLACGFTPLHLQTFLAAHLQLALPERRVTVTPGLYGNLAGTLEALPDAASPDAVVIALEWADLDPRRDYRSAGSWGLAAAADIVAGARMMLGRMAAAMRRIPSDIRVAVSPPMIPLPPVFPTQGWQASQYELALRAEVLHFAAEMAQDGRGAVINMQRVAEASPAAARFDLKSDLYNGLPYTVEHADRLAAQLAIAVAPPPPKKGIISDLDDTLWSGIAGEVGPEAVTWDLASHAQLHGIYQKLLSSLAECGTLIGVASKNDPGVVAKVFERADLLIRPDQVFPVEAHWNAKSGSVARILETWNISADSVIFVDDSPMELAEVAAAHPGIECVLFPKNDYAAAAKMFQHLRDRCGKERISKDDGLRLESIRQGAAFRDHASAGATPENFLKSIGAAITFDLTAAGEPRVLELVNKTNQFNLNGERYTQPDWKKLVTQPGAVLAAVSYEDKFGPLGTIAVAAGRIEGRKLALDVWVMSCRAFGRRIEYQTLKNLFETTGAGEIEFRFVPTAKNGPLRDFLKSFLGEEPAGKVRLERAQFEANCPALYHEIREMRRAEAHG